MRALALALAVSGCGGASSWAATELQLAQVPAGLRCLRVVASGATRTVETDLPVGAGERAVFALAGLPTGEVVFTADGFALDCGSVGAGTPRAWFAVPVVVALAANVDVQISLTLYR